MFHSIGRGHRARTAQQFRCHGSKNALLLHANRFTVSSSTVSIGSSTARALSGVSRSCPRQLLPSKSSRGERAHIDGVVIGTKLLFDV